MEKVKVTLTMTSSSYQDTSVNLSCSPHPLAHSAAADFGPHDVSLNTFLTKNIQVPSPLMAPHVLTADFSAPPAIRVEPHGHSD